MRSRRTLLLAFVIILFLHAHTLRAGTSVNAGRGAVTVHVPPSYTGSPVPLVVVLHGYTGSGTQAQSYFGFNSAADALGFLTIHPDGTLDSMGERYWNATDACCDLYGANGPDDSTYLTALVDSVRACYNVDPARVYFFGHSNGGFMSYRMACDHSDWVAGVASLAGATWDDPMDCAPAGPVHVLQIHGTSDNTILYNGGSIGGVPYPGAVATVEQWATFNGCALTTQTLPSINLVFNLPGNETTVTQYVDACNGGGSGELWTMVGGSHSPFLVNNFADQVAQHLLDHPKSIPSSIPRDRGRTPGSVALLPNTPNPFNATTTLRYELDREALVSLRVFDVAGRLVRTLFSNREKIAGVHGARWDGADDNGVALSAGVYFAVVETAGKQTARKIVLIR